MKPSLRYLSDLLYTSIKATHRRYETWNPVEKLLFLIVPFLSSFYNLILLLFVRNFFFVFSLSILLSLFTLLVLVLYGYFKFNREILRSKSLLQMDLAHLIFAAVFWGLYFFSLLLVQRCCIGEIFL